MKEQTYILLDSKSELLAKGLMLSPPGAEEIRVRVLEGKAEAVAHHEVVQLIGIGRGTTALRCHLRQRREDLLTLDRMETLNPELRRALRIPVCFASFLYPRDGAWTGRMACQSIDLSCGGVAFYAPRGLDVGETVEIVIPITTRPLLMRAKLLRLRELKNERNYYAAKFVDMCVDEENMICEAVFGIQLESRARAI